MDIVDTKELPDGGAELTIELTVEEVQLLLQDALRRILEGYVTDAKKAMQESNELL